MTAACFVGDARADGVSAANRSLHYGDGLFETMRVQDGGVPLLKRHLSRLRDGARRLGIVAPGADVLAARIDAHIAGCEGGVLKLLLARGEGGRGYAPMADALPFWMLSLHPLPQLPAGGLRLGWCGIRVAIQPALAGIKHCNRLEQVLARAEVEAASHDEGLLQDVDGRVVSATSANLLLLRGGRWTTPPVERCGVAGVLRGWLLDAGLVDVAETGRDEAESADALALCNAVRGILPVASLDARAWAPHPALDELQNRLAMAYPMFTNKAGRA
ncbi:aminodeoxychorismate lyase [Thermomonas brevis]